MVIFASLSNFFPEIVSVGIPDNFTDYKLTRYTNCLLTDGEER